MIMVGYSGWTMERSTTVVATVPLLADGIKWLGYFRSSGLHYNLGWYTGRAERRPVVLVLTTSRSSRRVGFLPILQEKGRTPSCMRRPARHATGW